MELSFDIFGYGKGILTSCKRNDSVLVFCLLRMRFEIALATWFKVPIKNTKSESGAERLGLVSMHAGEVSGAVLDLFGSLSSL